ncbi:hypothetical protein MHY1_p00013 (plasmid) [Methylovirgula sp. HY1]|nr:hypothetical protein MHY1_p00013 [Methylovirgula sp. HY1]
MIDRTHDLPIVRQAKVLNISRGTVYYKPRAVSTEELKIMRRLDELHLDYPFAGSRMLRDMLNREGGSIGRRHVSTLMKRMGIEAIYRRPNTSKPAPGHRIYPYLLRGLKVERANQVWAMDISYIPMARGFVYLAAVVDWFSRRVLSHRVSITMEAAFCVEAVEEALAKHGKPEIFNTDQGSQFTCTDFTGLLIENGIAISMDGKGSWRDNVFVERLWRSVKYEEVYLKAYESVSEARASIGRYLDFYNRASEHPSVYVIEGKRLCWLGCDPVGYFGFCSARLVMDCAADVVRAARAKIQGPSGKGWMASISLASAASLRVFGAICMSRAALLRLSQCSFPSSAGLCTGMR